MYRAERALVAAREELGVALNKVYKLETCLGYRKKVVTAFDRMVIWKRVLGKLRSLRQFGLEADARAYMREDASSLAEALMKAKESLVNLQREKGARERELLSIVAKWQARTVPRSA